MNNSDNEILAYLRKRDRVIAFVLITWACISTVAAVEFWQAVEVVAR